VNTDKHWRVWGRQDPYFAVLSDSRFRRGGNRQEFFASGIESVNGLIATAKRHFGLNQSSALEFGSGVGRLTIPLAQQFQTVTGVEISEAMIEEAKSNCAKSGIDNVQFVRSDDELAAVHGKFDFVVSLLTLQHIPVKRGMRIVSRLFDKLDANGVIAIHFPIRIRLSWPECLIYDVKQSVPASHYLFNLIQGRRLAEPLMQMNAYHLADVMESASARNIHDFAMAPHLEKRFTSVILFARK
jgi:2-polyprenyl-3-methyl-5-hydroxy-6-metoxy-1,4-benzoquinol methylase